LSSETHQIKLLLIKLKTACFNCSPSFDRLIFQLSSNNVVIVLWTFLTPKPTTLPLSTKCPAITRTDHLLRSKKRNFCLISISSTPSASPIDFSSIKSCTPKEIKILWIHCYTLPSAIMLTINRSLVHSGPTLGKIWLRKNNAQLRDLYFK